MSLFWRFYIPFFVLHTGKRRAARASWHRGNNGGSATLLLPFGLDSTTAPSVVVRSAAGSFQTPNLKKETSHKTPGNKVRHKRFPHAVSELEGSDRWVPAWEG